MSETTTLSFIYARSVRGVVFYRSMKRTGVHLPYRLLAEIQATSSLRWSLTEQVTDVQ